MKDGTQDARSRPRGLMLERANRAGAAMGLRSGDMLIHVDGRPLDGNLNTLRERLAAFPAQTHVLGFWRGGQHWLLSSESASFGRW